jgi:hypothetical protein
MLASKIIEFRFRQMGLSKDAPQCATSYFSMPRDDRSDHAVSYRLCELYMATGLSRLIKSGLQQLASELSEMDRLHAAISNSK